jgi:hypothetical protein
MSTCIITSASGAVETNQAIPDAISTLVSRAKDGDWEAFTTLFELYKNKVYSICVRMTGNAAEAEDLTQDAFV